MRSALAQHWAQQSRELNRHLDGTKAISDINKDKSFWEKWSKAYLALLLPFIGEAAQIGADDGAMILELTWALGVDSDLYNLQASAWARKSALRLARGLTTTDRRIIKNYITGWIESGEPMPALTDRIGSYLNNVPRGKRIAVTEATNAYAEGNIASWDASGVVSGKIWNTARDERVCPFCGPMDGQISLLAGQYWWHTRGGSDMALSVYRPAAHPSCRCWLSPWVGDMSEYQ